MFDTRSLTSAATARWGAVAGTAFRGGLLILATGLVLVMAGLVRIG